MCALQRRVSIYCCDTCFLRQQNDTHFMSVYLCDAFKENVHRVQEKCIYDRNKPSFFTSSDNHQINRFKTSSDLILIWSDQIKSEDLIWNLIWLPNTELRLFGCRLVRRLASIDSRLLFGPILVGERKYRNMKNIEKR